MNGYSEPDAARVTGLDRQIGRIEDVLTRWFPAPAFVGAGRIDDYPVLPEERALVVNAVPRRRCEFATGRWLSRQGLRSFGLPDRPIGTGRLRNPLWPEPAIGTISHDGDMCAVVLMQRHAHPEAGIGIDLVSLPQRAGRMSELVAMFVADAREMTAVGALDLPVDPALLLFSLKESAIKAMSFRLDDFIDMRAIEVRHDRVLGFTMSGEAIGAELFAATAGDYLVTAAKVWGDMPAERTE